MFVVCERGHFNTGWHSSCEIGQLENIPVVCEKGQFNIGRHSSCEIGQLENIPVVCEKGQFNIGRHSSCEIRQLENIPNEATCLCLFSPRSRAVRIKPRVEQRATLGTRAKHQPARETGDSRINIVSGTKAGSTSTTQPVHTSHPSAAHTYGLS